MVGLHKLKLLALGLTMPFMMKAQEADSTAQKSPWNASISTSINAPATVYKPGFFVGSTTNTTYATVGYKNLSAFVWDNTDYNDGTYERDYGVSYAFAKDGKKFTPKVTAFYSDFINNKLNGGNNVLMTWLSGTYKNNGWVLDATLHNVFHFTGEKKTTDFVEDVINTNNTIHLSASKTYNFPINEKNNTAWSITPALTTSFNNDFFFDGERFMYGTPSVQAAFTKDNVSVSGKLGYQLRTVESEDIDFFTNPNPNQLHGNVTVTYNVPFKTK